MPGDVRDALEDDLNAPLAIAHLHELAGSDSGRRAVLGRCSELAERIAEGVAVADPNAKAVHAGLDEVPRRAGGLGRDER